MTSTSQALTSWLSQGTGSENFRESRPRLELRTGTLAWQAISQTKPTTLPKQCMLRRWQTWTALEYHIEQCANPTPSTGVPECTHIEPGSRRRWASVVQLGSSHIELPSIWWRPAGNYRFVHLHAIHMPDTNSQINGVSGCLGLHCRSRASASTLGFVELGHDDLARAQWPLGTFLRGLCSCAWQGGRIATYQGFFRIMGAVEIAGIKNGVDEVSPLSNGQECSSSPRCSPLVGHDYCSRYSQSASVYLQRSDLASPCRTRVFEIEGLGLAKSDSNPRRHCRIGYAVASTSLSLPPWLRDDVVLPLVAHKLQDFKSGVRQRIPQRGSCQLRLTKHSLKLGGHCRYREKV